MALSKDKKAEVVAEVSDLLNSSKLTVLARYPGTSVKAMQELRRQSRDNGTTVRVIKNRLFKKALEGSEKFKGIDASAIEGQLLYAFNSEDEVAPAQSLANFAKLEPQIELVAGLSADGQLLTTDDVKMLASLPSKQQLRGQLVSTIQAPISGFVRVLSGNIRGVLNALQARAEQLNN